MTRPHLLPIAEQRPATKRLIWLTLHAPELARSVRPGQYLLVRCSAPGSHDPLLRRPLFVAAAEEAIGQIGLLYAPDDRGLAWLARGGPGDEVDVIGPFGEPLALDRGTRTVLLVGQGPGLAALLLLCPPNGAPWWVGCAAGRGTRHRTLAAAVFVAKRNRVSEHPWRRDQSAPTASAVFASTQEKTGRSAAWACARQHADQLG